MAAAYGTSSRGGVVTPSNRSSSSNNTTAGGGSSRSNAVTRITGNVNCPFMFNLTHASSVLTIQAKNRTSKDTFFCELSREQIRNLGFHQNIKGFYNRLKLAIEGNQHDELRAYYWFYTDSIHERKAVSTPGDKMALVLEECSRFDEDAVQWTVTLPQLKIKETEKLHEKLEDVVDVVDQRYSRLKQAQEHIIDQIKQKFNSEKEERELLSARMDKMENALRKLSVRLKEIQGVIQERSHQTDQEVSASQSSILSVHDELTADKQTMNERIQNLEKALNDLVDFNKRKFEELRPKLMKLKTRKDFTTIQAYIDYMCQTLDSWDHERFGPILVRVSNNAGKAKAFVGLVGEPIKWNSTICKVKWFGLGQTQPESVRWTALDIYLPLSAYYYPDYVGDLNAQMRTSSIGDVSDTTM